MKLFDILFFVGSVFAFCAGLSEIKAVFKRYRKKETQNWKTPLFMMIVKLTRLPKFVQLAQEGQVSFSLSKWLPAISAMAAAMCWGVAFYFSYFSGSHQRGSHQNETDKQNLKVM